MPNAQLSLTLSFVSDYNSFENGGIETRITQFIDQHPKHVVRTCNLIQVQGENPFRFIVVVILQPA